MKIIIHDHRKIVAIQEEFNLVFPYLKIEFFSKSSLQGGTSSGKEAKHTNKTLAECRTIHHKGEITINPSMTVSEMEKNFRDVYGLEVQLLRKSGKAWLETTVTDKWTLEDQNREGEALSK